MKVKVVYKKVKMKVKVKVVYKKMKVKVKGPR